MEITLHFATQGTGIENTLYLKNPWIIKSCLLSAFIGGEFQHFSWRKASYRRRTQVEYYRKNTVWNYSHNTVLFRTASAVSWHTELCMKIALLHQSKYWRQVSSQCALKFAGGFLSALCYILFHHILLKRAHGNSPPFSPQAPQHSKIRSGARITTTCIINCRPWKQFCWDIRGRGAVCEE